MKKTGLLITLMLSVLGVSNCQFGNVKSADGTVEISDDSSPVYTVSGHMTGNGDFFPDSECRSLLKTKVCLDNLISVNGGFASPEKSDPDMLSTKLDGWAAPVYWEFRKKYLPREKTYMGFKLMDGLNIEPCVFVYVVMKVKYERVRQQYAEDGMTFTHSAPSWVCVQYLSINPPKAYFIQKVLHEYSERQKLFNNYRYRNGELTTENDRGRIVAGDLWTYRPYRKQLMIDNGNMIGAQCYDEAAAEREKQ